MPHKNEDLHGSAPDSSNVALLLIDLISDFDFEGGDELLENTLPAASKIADLKKKAKAAKVPVIYVNDNFGKWQSDFKKLLTHCLADSAKGCKIADLLKPDDEEDYFVLKPKHSGFYSTTLDLLLEYLKVKTLILTGVTTDICILFTANDAYMRDFDLFVPQDCVATANPDENKHALDYLERVLKADTKSSAEIDFEQLKNSKPEEK